MIQSNEVRRLNWVEFEGRHFQIDVIAEVYPTLDTAEFGIGVVDWNNINHILLTEEWLVRFDFEWYAQIKPKGYWMNGFCIEKIDSMLIHYKTGVGLKYVHQLQNLYFALTGQELTIKND